MLIEILSPSTEKLDKFTKFNAPLRAGVRGYWILDPDTKAGLIYLMQATNDK